MCDMTGMPGNSTNITISWDSDRVNESEYDIINLYKDGNPLFVTDMKNEDSYTFEAETNVVYYFLIKTYAFNNILNLEETWNLISLPFNESFSKNEIFVQNNNANYSWSDAVSEGIILEFLYKWNRTSQSYEISNILEPGHGYWIYTYSSCDLMIATNITDDNYITDLQHSWNIMGLTSDEPVDKQNLTVEYNNTSYTWQDAVNAGIVLDFIYKWDADVQSYDITELLRPGNAFWLYAYYPCRLLRPAL
jgi:hypothetical protein